MAKRNGAPPAGASAPRQAAPAGFGDLLFGHVPPEDLLACAEDDLARIADAAYRTLSAPRRAGTAAVTLREETLAGGTGSRQLTIVEIVNDNMPFLLDSTLAELADQGLEPRLVAHPILAVARDEAGALTRFAGDAGGRPVPGTLRESFIHVHVDLIAEPQRRERLVAGLTRVFGDVRVAVEDWSSMRVRLAQAMQAYRNDPPPLEEEEVSEALGFLEWASVDNFTFLGMREYRYGDAKADPVSGSGLGILRDPSVMVLRRGREMVATTPEIRAFLSRPEALIITKANVKSRVHRRVHLDYVGVKLFAPDGRLEGELRIVGLLTSSAYTAPPPACPTSGARWRRSAAWPASTMRAIPAAR